MQDKHKLHSNTANTGETIKAANRAVWGSSSLSYPCESGLKYKPGCVTYVRSRSCQEESFIKLFEPLIWKALTLPFQLPITPLHLPFEQSRNWNPCSPSAEAVTANWNHLSTLNQKHHFLFYLSIILYIPASLKCHMNTGCATFISFVLVKSGASTSSN